MGINVLSLFDGMSCGRIALERAGIEVNNYYSSEIDKYAIQIADKNYPQDTNKRLGDVTKIDTKFSENIDLLIGGSPCQNLSITVINNIIHNKGLEGQKSKLFYEYVRILKEVNPRYFLLENVASMKNVDRDIISQVLGVEPLLIDSSTISAQDRKRYYWTNIPSFESIKEKDINLKDIVLSAEEVEKKYWYNNNFKFNGEDKKIIATLDMKGHDILKRVYNLNGKCGTLTSCRGGNLQKKVYQDGKCRKLTPLEYERLQTISDGYTEGVSDSQRYNMLGNGWTVDVIAHILKGVKGGQA